MNAEAEFHVLSELVAPMPPEIFLEHYRSRQYMRIGRGSANCYGNVLTVQDLDSFLQCEQSPAAFFNVVSNGARIPAEQWSEFREADRGTALLAMPERLFSLYQGGATLILNGVDRAIPRLGLACRRLARELGILTQANVYITPPSARGFEPHVDQHDVLVLQISGRKCWTVYPQGDAGVDLEIAAGDLLYIPRGLRHEAKCPDFHSIHVTLGLKPAYAYQLIEQLAAAAKIHSDFQGIVPTRFESAEHNNAFAAEFLGRLQRLVAEVPPSALIERRLGTLVAKQAKGWQGRLTDLLLIDEVTLDTVVCVRSEIITAVERHGSAFHLVFAGNSVVIPGFLRPCLDRILSGKPFSIRELEGLLTDEGRIGFVRPFLSSGLLTIVKL